MVRHNQFDELDFVPDMKRDIKHCRCAWCDAEAISYFQQVAFCSKCYKKFESFESELCLNEVVHHNLHTGIITNNNLIAPLENKEIYYGTQG